MLKAADMILPSLFSKEYNYEGHLMQIVLLFRGYTGNVLYRRGVLSALNTMVRGGLRGEGQRGKV